MAVAMQTTSHTRLEDTKERFPGLETQRGRHNASPDPSKTSPGFGIPGILTRTKSGNNVTQLEPSPSIDPLSQHILERRRPDTAFGKAKTSPVIDESPEREDRTPGLMSPPARSSTEPLTARSEIFPVSAGGKKNRVSFLNRFRLGKKDTTGEVEEDDEPQDKRPDGSDAEMFSQPIGYIPRFAEPPKYIKVKAQGKKEKDFDRVFLAQELRGLSGVELAQAGGRRINTMTKTRGDAIWALEFSKDGRYLASGGEDHIVRMWKVLSSDEDRQESELDIEAGKTPGLTRLSAPVFKRKPIHEYEGHTGTILDLSWSKNNFLLSSSMDKTVRLWHSTRPECLCAFKHTDHITSIQFHPRDDRFFLAGSLDSKLRLWSIPDKSVAYCAKTNDLITAVAFTPDGKTCMAGCLTGSVYFFETDELRSLTQMQIRSSGRKSTKGSKITSIQAMNYPLNGDVKLLITSNDSRVRIYNYRDKTLHAKFKGAENHTSQIRASFGDDARYIICGSEDKKVYIWPTDAAERDKDKRPMEYFEAHNATVTVAVIAPIRTRQLLQTSGDPIFSVCNPPPVQLISRSESQSSGPRSIASVDGEYVPPTPSKTKPEETPAYQARTCHKNGNIIVTADSTGKIKVFRQDCAYEKRLKVNENWDSGSTISRKMLKRTSSVATRNSRNSVDPLSFPNTERVQSWRQSLDRFSMPSHSPRVSNDAFTKSSPRGSTFARSRSPRKLSANSKLNPGYASSSAANTPTMSSAAFATAFPHHPARQDSHRTPSELDRRPSELSSNASQIAPDELILPEGGIRSIELNQKAMAAHLAHSLARQKTRDLSEPSSAEGSKRQSLDIHSGKPQQDSSGHLLPGDRLHPVSTAASILTDEMSGQEDSDHEDAKCRRCGSQEFKARKKSKGQAIVCAKCGLELV